MIKSSNFGNKIKNDIREVYESIEKNDKISIVNNLIYTAHEGLLLNYEACFVRKCPNGKYYDLSAHILWIGIN